jgi:hypothetical protein
MRLFGKWTVVSMLLAGCATWGGTRPSRDAEWKAELDRLAADPSPGAALRRAELVHAALVDDPARLDRLGLDRGTVEAEGLDSLYRALVAKPERERAWRLFRLWKARLGASLDAVRASQAICAAADEVHWNSTLQLCGDLLAQAGKQAEAIARWRGVLPFATTPAERNALIVRIEHASLHPDTDLAGVTPMELQIANSWEQSRERRQREARSAERAEATCFGQCGSAYAGCSASAAAIGLWYHAEAQDACNDALSACNGSCRAYER